ncbi:MAG: hydrogenase formation protein HypD [Rhodospirillales bacterium]|nr:hydrogenase formation protein HypD [Rhodospirillales bacterium]
MSGTARDWLERIRALPIDRPVRIMNVCGGHERSITMAGLRGVLPKAIELIPGPGCPVCICPEEDIYRAIRLALDHDVILVTYGDMLRVPANVAKGEPRSLEQAKAAGADVRPIASPLEAAAIARSEPGRTVVFFAVGFETTTAPLAALICEGIPDNLLLLVSCRRTWPAVALLLAAGRPGFDALVAPGHVSTVMGPEEWAFVAEEHGLPVAIAGFTADTLLAAMYAVLRQWLDGRPRLDNLYPRAVRPGGNPRARACIEATLDIVDAPWRGIGTIAASGYGLKAEFAANDADTHFPVSDELRRRAGEMPPGCGCAEVVLGRIYPTECKLYGKACTPRNPVGPCMVSDEGACRIWWAGGARAAAAAE